MNIPTDHFDPDEARRRANRRRRTPLAEILVENSSYSRGHVKKRLFQEGLKERRCELCGIGEMWHGRRMSLILDHINGISNDHRLENLRIVCPNCAATLGTHCGRNLPRERVCAGCGSTFAPEGIRHRYCSLRCFNDWRIQLAGTPLAVSSFGVARKSRRKVERPPYEQLLREIAVSSYLAVGRKYGVSDNAVRKWVRFYQNEAERQRQEDVGELITPNGEASLA